MNKHIFLTKWKATNAIFNDANVQTECSVFEGTRFLLNSKNSVDPTQLIGYDPCQSFVSRSKEVEKNIKELVSDKCESIMRQMQKAILSSSLHTARMFNLSA